jgi:hypothetical protein
MTTQICKSSLYLSLYRLIINESFSCYVPSIVFTKVNVWNQEPPQPGDSRPVLSSSQRVLSRQMMRNWEPWITNIRKSNNNKTLQELDFHPQKIIPATSIQDLNPHSCTDNVHSSVLSFEMTVIEPGDDEIPTLKLTWKPLGWLSHIKCRTIDDLLPLVLWEVWFCCNIGVPTPTLNV